MFSTWRWQYRRINETSLQNEKNDSPDEEPKAASSHRYSVFILATLLFATVIFTGIPSYYALSPRRNNSVVGPCGNSSAEALALGCSFDQLMWAWYPAHCPHYANDEYLKAEPDEPWRFYVDPYNKLVASGDEWIDVLDNKKPAYGERREHLTHCVFMYLSLGQIIRDGTRYTPHQTEYGHLEHCADVLLEALRNDTARYEIQTQASDVHYDQDC